MAKGNDLTGNEPSSESRNVSSTLPIVKDTEEKQSWLSRSVSFMNHENFRRFFRFGNLDQNILLLGVLTGVGLDKFIQRRFGLVGYGPIIGAGVSNWIADAIASLPEGEHALAGITLGTLLPLLPVGAYMLLRHSFDTAHPPKPLVACCVGSIIGIFAHEYYIRVNDPDVMTPPSSSAEQ